MPSLSEVKAHLNITSSTNDSELSDFLDSATDLVNEIANTSPVQTYTETLWADRGAVFLSHIPVVAVTSVVSAGETLTGWTMYPHGAITDLGGSREVVVIYTAGVATPSARVHTAILMVVARLWETQRGNAPATSLQGGEGPAFTPGLQGIIAEVQALLGDTSSLGVVV